MKPLIRVGTTSYIKPLDILPNVRYLADLVDDIELVLFESEELSNLPDEATIRELKSIAADHNLTYTVHFPLDIHPGSRDEALRCRSVEAMKRIIALTESLEPFGYVLHLSPDHWGPSPSDEIDAWRSALDRSLDELLGSHIVDPSSVCAETLSYPFALVQPLVQQHGLSVTLDIGHIWLMGYDADEAAHSLLAHTRICHLHGVSGDKDHLGLDEGDQVAIERFLCQLVQQAERDGQERVLTVEVFGEREFEASLSLLRTSRAMMGHRLGGAYANY